MVDSSKTFTPGQPVLFLAVGAGATAAVEQLPRAADELAVEIYGPFGFVSLAEPLEETGAAQVSLFGCEWISKVASPRAHTGYSETMALGAEKGLPAGIVRIIRELCLDQSLNAPAASARVAVASYFVIDLSCPHAVASGLELLDAVRQADPSLDVTGIALTGRTAQSKSGRQGPWFDALRTLLDALQPPEGESLLRRLYILDGQDTNGAWLQRPEEMHRQAAEFMLHHGVSPYRDHLRRSEVQRVSTEAGFASVCGSFACRTMRRDPVAVAEGLAEELARKDLVRLGEGSLDEAQMNEVAEEARSLAEQLGKLVNTKPAKVDEEAERILRSTFTRVCKGQPVLRLKWLLRKLESYLEQLVSGAVLVRGYERRCRAAAGVHQQQGSVYGRLGRCIQTPYSRWPDPTDPYGVVYVGGPNVRVTHPGSANAYCLGLFVLLAGAAMVPISALQWWLALLAGPVAVLGGLIMALPSRWTSHSRTAHEEDRPLPAGPSVTYRRKAPGLAVSVALTLALGGLALWLAGPFVLSEPFGWASVRLGQTGIVLAILTTLAMLAGLALVAAGGPYRRPRDAATEKEAPDMAPLPVTGWRFGGAVLAAGGWSVQMLLTRGLLPPASPLGWATCGGGLLLIVLGVAVARWPRQARRVLTWSAPVRPLHPTDVVTKKNQAQAAVAREVEQIITWCETLLRAGPSSRPEPARQWPPRRPVGCILDAVAGDWRKQLADHFHDDRRQQGLPGFAEEARRGETWADCLVRELRKPTGGLRRPAFLFALNVAREWLGSRPWAQVLKGLRPDPQSLDFLVTQCVAPHWPNPRGEPATDASVIAIGTDLWDLVAPLAHAARNHRLEPVAGYGQEMLTVVRIVQGLQHGWYNWRSLWQQREPYGYVDDPETNACLHELIRAAEELPGACRQDLAALGELKVRIAAEQFLAKTAVELTDVLEAASSQPDRIYQHVDACDDVIRKLLAGLREPEIGGGELPGPELSKAWDRYQQRCKDLFDAKRQREGGARGGRPSPPAADSMPPSSRPGMPPDRTAPRQPRLREQEPKDT